MMMIRGSGVEITEGGFKASVTLASAVGRGEDNADSNFRDADD